MYILYPKIFIIYITRWLEGLILSLDIFTGGKHIQFTYSHTLGLSHLGGKEVRFDC